MQTQVTTSKSLPAATVTVGPSKMFTFPTRLAGAWKAEGLEINLPGYCLRRGAIELSVSNGSTQPHQIPARSIRRQLSRRLGSPIEMKDKYLFDARFETDGNIAHILTNVAPALLLTRNIFTGVTVILRSNATCLGKEVYERLGFSVLCTDRDIHGTLVGATDARDGAYEAWYPALFGRLEFEGYTLDTPERVFISRKGTRRLNNEQEVEEALRKYGFRKVYFEDIPIAEQWSIARNARAIAGVHGSALSSLLFNCTGVRVLELFHPGYVVNIYRHLTNAMGGIWCGVTGRMPGDIVRQLDEKQSPRRFANSPTRIDTDSLCRGLEYLGMK